MNGYPAQRERAYSRDKGRCIRCVRRPGEQIHHRQGRRIADPHRLSNLITLCADCHRYVHAHPAESYDAGTMVPRNGIRTTTGTPIKTTRGWILLADDGSYITTEAPA